MDYVCEKCLPACIDVLLKCAKSTCFGSALIGNAVIVDLAPQGKCEYCGKNEAKYVCRV